MRHKTTSMSASPQSTNRRGPEAAAASPSRLPEFGNTARIRSAVPIDNNFALREVVWVILDQFRTAVFCCFCRCGHVGNALALSSGRSRRFTSRRRGKSTSTSRPSAISKEALIALLGKDAGRCRPWLGRTHGGKHKVAPPRPSTQIEPPITPSTDAEHGKPGFGIDSVRAAFATAGHQSGSVRPSHTIAWLAGAMTGGSGNLGIGHTPCSGAHQRQRATSVERAPQAKSRVHWRQGKRGKIPSHMPLRLGNQRLVHMLRSHNSGET